MARCVVVDGSMLGEGRWSIIHLKQRIWCPLERDATECDCDCGTGEDDGAAVVAKLAYGEERVDVKGWENVDEAG
jgi:hypothetical protein